MRLGNHKKWGVAGGIGALILARFEPVLTKFSPFHHMYAPLCALRTYLRAVWWSHLELGEGCRLEDIHIYKYISTSFRFLAGTFDGYPSATRRRGGYSETLAGGQPGPARAAPPATFGVATRGSGSSGGCGSGGRPQRAAPGKQHVTRHDNSSSTWGGPKVTKAKRVGEVRVMHSARKLSCIVLA